MKGSFTKTTILLVCTTLGLTIGIGSAFAQKLVDQSQVKGEVPIDQPNFIQKKQLVPEHLKPKQTEEPKETNPPKVKGEKPLDVPKERFDQQKRLAPETPRPEPEQPSSLQRKNNEQTTPNRQEKPKERSTKEDGQNQEKPAPQQGENKQVEKGTEQAPIMHQSPKQEPADRNEQPSLEQQLPQSNGNQDRSPSQDQTGQKKQHSQNEDGHEIKIPEKVEVESSDGRKVDITAVIEDIFGQVNASKKETEAIQKRMENSQPDPKVALQQPNRSADEISPKQTEESETEQQYDLNNPPRTEQHGVMPMTASNDLHGVLIGLGMAAVGILYVLFRKGE